MHASLRWIRLISIPLLVLGIALAWASPAFAAEADCLAAGGTWDSFDPDTGTCSYPAGSTAAVNACIFATSAYEEIFEFDVVIAANCLHAPIPTSFTRITSDGGSETAFTLPIKGSVRGTVEFFGGTCKQNCTVDTVLPDLAKEMLDESPLAAVYVRVDGGAGTGSYRVCFNNFLEEDLNIYQFVGGNWVLAVHSHSNPICSVASGDSAFYLH